MNVKDSSKSFVNSGESDKVDYNDDINIDDGGNNEYNVIILIATVMLLITLAMVMGIMKIFILVIEMMMLMTALLVIMIKWLLVMVIMVIMIALG